MTAITIAIVDDHPLFREGVSRSLSEIKDFVVVGEGASADDAVTLAASHMPDVLLLDVSMPGGGIGAISEILVRSPQTNVLMLTASEEVDALVAALRRGAVGYVVKGIGSRGLAVAIRTVVGGSRYISPTMRAKVEQSLLDRPASLTRRETEVMELVAEGLTNKHIARRLDLQEKTIKHHMTEILSKIGASNRTEAAIRWRQGAQGSAGPEGAPADR
ncbi:response regulator [Rhizobium leguminosarum]|uniref:response regulator n=1 Tax=Rhizobium leguminosarum TaxID=384 RepID=UPI003F9482F1